MSDALQGKRIAIIATDGVEQVELEKPRDAVMQAGATTQLLSIDTGEIQAVTGASICVCGRRHQLTPTPTSRGPAVEGVPRYMASLTPRRISQRLAG